MGPVKCSLFDFPFVWQKLSGRRPIEDLDGLW